MTMRFIAAILSRLLLVPNLCLKVSDNCRAQCLYPEGVADQSPGLPRQRLPWDRSLPLAYPEGVASKARARMMQPLRGSSWRFERPRVAADAATLGFGLQPLRGKRHWVPR